MSDILSVLSHPDDIFSLYPSDGNEECIQATIPAMLGMSIAQVPYPEKFVANLKLDPNTKPIVDFKKGTTTLGFVFQAGVIIAVDSRASMGSYIASQTVRKVIEINDYLLGTMAGGAADCSFWERHLARLCRMYELRNNERIPVAAASNLLANIFFQYRGYGLSCGTMVAGCDKNGPQLYYVDDRGSRVEGKLFSVGSGSTYAYGVLDSAHRFDMTLDEAVELGKRAIYHAAHRDAASGGYVRVYHVHERGWTKIDDGTDIMQLHDLYSQQNAAAETNQGAMQN